jgi:hypothetical protein
MTNLVPKQVLIILNKDNNEGFHLSLNRELKTKKLVSLIVKCTGLKKGDIDSSAWASLDTAPTRIFRYGNGFVDGLVHLPDLLTWKAFDENSEQRFKFMTLMGIDVQNLTKDIRLTPHNV